jgi:hypothetical protein
VSLHQVGVGLAEGRADGVSDGEGDGAGVGVSVGLGLDDADTGCDGEAADEAGTGVRGTVVGRFVVLGSPAADGLALGSTFGTITRRSIRKSKLGIIDDQSGDTDISTCPYCERKDRASSSDLPITPALS